MSYRRGVAERSIEVLPSFGGISIDAPERRLRLDAPMEPGWWRCRIDGWRAHAFAPAEAPDLSSMPRIVGHFVGGWLFVNRGAIERVHILPQQQPPPLAPCGARRWWSGEHIFIGRELEEEGVEWQARFALESEQRIGDLAGSPPSLRAAFGFALLQTIGEQLLVPCSPRELPWRQLRDIAVRGGSAAREALAELRATRALAERARPTRLGADNSTRPFDPRPIAERAADALDPVGATLLSVRAVDDDRSDVVFRVLGERFRALVDAGTLEVIDPGIVLARRSLSLASLPTVIAEAIASSTLRITRW